MLLRNIFGSIVAFCQQQIQAIKDADLSSNMVFINLDAHSNIRELELVDYLGITGLSVSTEGKVHTINVAFGIMLAEDKNLLRHIAIMDRLYEALQPEKQLVYYDADTAEAGTWMVVLDGVDLLPVSRDELRALQMISVTMLLNPGA